MKVQSKFVSKLSFITLNFACQDCKVFIGTSCIIPLAKGNLVDHVLHTLIMYKDCLGIMKEQCKNSRLPHLLMIVVHGETLWSPAPQPMDDDDDDDIRCSGWQYSMLLLYIANQTGCSSVTVLLLVNTAQRFSWN